jgi:hypothetical protein
MRWQADGRYVFEHNSSAAAPAAGTDNDLVNGAGTSMLNLSGLSAAAPFTFVLSPTNRPPSPLGQTVTYTVASFANGVTGFNPVTDQAKFAFSGLYAGTPTVGLAGGNTVLTLSFQPVPEPGHVLLACAGAAWATAWWRRRKG